MSPILNTRKDAPQPRQSDVHIGQQLRAARIAKGLSTSDVAQALKLQDSFVTAIETLDQDALPSIGYVLGYVRAYANFIGEDGPKAVAQYKADTAVPVNLGIRSLPHFVPQRKVKLPRGFVPALSVFGAAAMLAFWYGSNTSAVATAPVDVTQNLSKPPSTPVPIPANILTLRAVAPSWVQVKDAQGNVLVSRIFTKGEEYVTEAGSRQTVSARDGAALVLYAGTDRLGVMGERGVSFTGKPIDAAVLIPALADIPLVPIETGTKN